MKFSLEWLGDFVDVAAAGGAAGVRQVLDQAGIPIESVARSGEDSILDAEITPNRPDAMGHRGLAREIGAMSGTPARDLGDRYAEPPSQGDATEELTSIIIQVPRQCRRFGARLVRDVRDAQAPERVRARLSAVGGKSISAAVDATNYVLWDTSQPLHAFDFDRLAGGLLIVRRARRGERLVTLDGVERVLDPSDLVVADAERAVSLAGIMGGLDTAVTSSTRNVLLEAAWWDPVTIRRTARRLGMHTDASHRFERGADPDAIPAALNLAARLILESAGGTVAPGFLDALGAAMRVRRTTLRLSRLRLLSGDSRIGLDFAEEALRRLGFASERKGKRLSVQIPLFRADARREDDLVEEVLRVWGYDRLPSRLPPATVPGSLREPLRAVEEKLTDRAAAAGFFETVSYPFVDRAADEGVWDEWLRATGTAPEPLGIENPLDATRRHLRATLLPGLLDSVSRNLRHGADGVSLFEVGRAFGAPGEPDRPESLESRRIAFATAGEMRGHWSTPERLRAADFFDAKGLVERLVEPWVAPEDLAWRPLRVGAFAPGAASAVDAPGGRLLGIVGLLSEDERRRRDMAVPVFAGELVLEALPSEPRPYRYREAPVHPAVVADLTFAQPRELTWAAVMDFVRRRGVENLESLRFHDRYEDPRDPSGPVKATVRLVFRSPDRTLEQQEVNEAVRRLAKEMEAELGVRV